MTRRRIIRTLLYVAVVGVSFLAGAFIERSAAGNFAELRAYDLRFLLRGRVPRERPVPLAIVGIDEESFQKIGDPLILWEGHFAAVINGLVEGGARTLGIDILFADATRFDPQGQQALAGALILAGEQKTPVILGYQVRSTGVEDLPAAIQFAASEHPVGYINLTTDADDFVRRQRLKDNSLQKPSFAMAIASSFAAKGNVRFNDSVSEILIDYRGETFPVVPFVQVLEAARTQDTAFLREQFDGRIVLIARYSRAGEEDLHATPYYYWPANPTNTGRRTPGIVIHANTISTLLGGKFIEPLDSFKQSALALGLIVAIALACVFFTPYGALAILASLTFGFLYYALISSFQDGIWVRVVWPVTGSMVCFGLAETVNYLLEGKDKRRIRNLFKRYVKEEVIHEILQNPDDLILQGKRRRIAVLFADIQGFTTRCESSEPEEIVSLLNVYFKEVVEEIHSNGGMVNSLMGDGLMALFGVPLENPDAPLNAVEAAIGMRRALIRVNALLAADGVKPINIGIGIHCGDAIVGNMGSPEMMEYTAIGDVVNTTARIESLTREAKEPILISEALYEALKGRMHADYCGRFQVKGKTAAVPVYKVPLPTELAGEPPAPLKKGTAQT